MKRFCALFIYMAVALVCCGQSAQRDKMSGWVRSLSVRQQHGLMPAARNGKDRELCAFVRVANGNADVLKEHGCMLLMQEGDICIVSIPLQRLNELSLDSRVVRIEAKQSCTVLMNETPEHVHATEAYESASLPQAFTGKGVIVGVEDVGFDLTHPNFYDAETGHYRIRRLWDQLAVHDDGSSLYVGADYTGTEELLSLQHSTDGLTETHGTHTTGTAAGGGAQTPYVGIAYQSDICLVANAVQSNTDYIDEDDIYKYTYATDVLGFKYIFDYAQRVGKPCVISFSEGSEQDFRGDDLLYYEMLSSLVGEGKILVASAGNNGWYNTYMIKPSEQTLSGTFLRSPSTKSRFTLKADGNYTLRMQTYGNAASQFTVTAHDVVTAEDSLLTATWQVGDAEYNVEISAYPSCYNEDETVFDVGLSAPVTIGEETPVSVSVIGNGTTVEMFCSQSYLENNSLAPELCHAERRSSVYSPGSAPDVICVGANSYRKEYLNIYGETIVYDKGQNGEIGDYSALGPTYDGRMKPDIVAPGTNIISSYNHYFIDAATSYFTLGTVVANSSHPFADTEASFATATYPWAATSGTSMSTPVVAGIIALWLEADPSLSPERVKHIMKLTANHTDPTLDYPNNQWGFGEINAYKGLLEILHLSHIEPLPMTTQSPVCATWDNDGALQIALRENVVGTIRVNIYTTDGILRNTCLLSAQHTSEKVMVPTGQIIVVELKSPDGKFNSSTLMRQKN